MNCLHCNKNFIPNHKNQKYCEKKCIYRARRLRIECASDRKRHWKKRNIQITISEYNNLFKQQGEKCKICGIHQSELKQRLAVDHNHTTGKIRGLLCVKCNTGLGNFKDSINMLQMAIHYLQS